MTRRPVTKAEGEMLMALAYTLVKDLDDEQLKSAVARWGQQPELSDKEFNEMTQRIDRARKALGLE